MDFFCSAKSAGQNVCAGLRLSAANSYQDCSRSVKQNILSKEQFTELTDQLPVFQGKFNQAVQELAEGYPRCLCSQRKKAHGCHPRDSIRFQHVNAFTVDDHIGAAIPTTAQRPMCCGGI
jgi:hypothetical protein